MTLWSAKLRVRAATGPQCLALACRLLANHPDDLLAFAGQLDQDLQHVAEEFQVAVSWVRELLQVQSLDARQPRRWQRDRVLRQNLGERYDPVSEAVAAVARQTVRASSVIENLNSRPAQLLFPAAPPRTRLLGLAAILSQPPAFPA